MEPSRKLLSILAVDDEVEYLDVMEILLEGAGYEIDKANSGEMALEMLDKQVYDLVISDLIMGGMDGLKLLEAIKEKHTETEVMLVTGYGSVKNAVEAMKMGAFSYFIKSHDPEELLMEIDKVNTMKTLKNNNELLMENQHKEQLVLTSKSPKFQRVLDLAKKAAESHANILILGESGVGKEVLAQYIHDCSDRQHEPFIAINCHAFSDNLLESELFGHEKGAFTGATDRRKGRFEAAKDGTILLDEIGDISLSTQVKLLRVLESKKIERLGSNQSVNTDFRLLSATNKDLKVAIENGEFREDLYYRISTITIEIPPLRERKEDLPVLIDFFIKKSSNELKKVIHGIDEEAMAYLLNHDYPGNVRELKNMIERLVVLADHGRIALEDKPGSPAPATRIETTEAIRPLKDIRQEVESAYIKKALEICNNNMTMTSKKLGISRRQLFNKIKEYDL